MHELFLDLGCYLNYLAPSLVTSPHEKKKKKTMFILE